jgi:hypothetical protein
MADGPTVRPATAQNMAFLDASASHTELNAYNGNGPTFCFFKTASILEHFYNVMAINTSFLNNCFFEVIFIIGNYCVTFHINAASTPKCLTLFMLISLINYAFFSYIITLIQNSRPLQARSGRFKIL